MLDRARYDRLLAGADPAPVIVTAAAEGERAGCLVTFHSPASIHPPLYAVWLSHRNRTYTVAEHAGVLTVHLLDERDLPLATLFASVSGHDADKFDRCTWSTRGAAVVLDTAGAWFTGTITDRVPTGDHTLFLLAPTEVGGTQQGHRLAFADIKDVPPGRPP